MESRRKNRSMWAAATAIVLVLSLVGCSGNHTNKNSGMPDPGPGKVASFALGKLNKQYDLDDTAVTDSGHVASDDTGNVYLMNDSNYPVMPILRLTPDGEVSAVAKIKQRYGNIGLATGRGGSLITGGQDGLFKLNKHGDATPLTVAHHFSSPDPIGVRPDGSVVVLDGSTLWTVSGSKATKVLEVKNPQHRLRGIVDETGKIYAVRGSLGDVEVLSPGSEPERLVVRGTVPGATGMLMSQLVAMDIVAAHGGGFYALLQKEPGKSGSVYVAHIDPSGAATIMAKGPSEKKEPCVAGKQYPALNTSCAIPWFIAQSGDRVLVLGGVGQGASPNPALAIRAYTR